MSTITTKDGRRFYSRLGNRAADRFPRTVGRCRPVIGTRRCCFFLKHGRRVIAHDRPRTWPFLPDWCGHDMDHYADA